ncbi:probable protein arginine N-methyltransferase 6 [Teleopsis dalmanni]|nr:probable protein arginine N-methyltransferase 6 [Teleopsis dalmanni]
MLKDRPRQEAYYQAIMSNSTMFKDKVVLDVGAGTGILSAFCAKAGARLVYAVEATNLAKIALQVIEENALTSIVKVCESKIEEFQLPETEEKVDIIVSEWMGFYLLHEGMLDSVLYARDHFLKPSGKMFPNETILYVAPCQVPSRYDDWVNVNGISMTKFAAHLREQKSKKPEVANVQPTDLLHEGTVMHWMNLEEVKIDELSSVIMKEVITVQRSGKFQGFCIWFDCRFPAQSYEDAVILSTGPRAPLTHWKQCIVVLPTKVCEEVEENQPIAFEMKMLRKQDNPRFYDLEVELFDPDDVEHPTPCDCFLTKCILLKTHLQTMDTS